MRRFERWVPWILLALGLVIRFWHYTTPNISMDEPFTLFHSQKPIAELMQLFRNENNPPFFFLIMHFWIGMLGLEPEMVRIVPTVISAVTAPVIYLFGKAHFGKTAGLAAALFFLFCNLHQYHAHDVRAYSLFTLLTVWSLHHYLNLKAGKRQDVVLLGLANALLLYNHFFGAIVIIIQGFSSVSIKKKWSVILPFLGSALLSLVLYSAYIPILWERFTASTAAGAGWLSKPGIESLYNMIWSFTNSPAVAVACILLVALIPAWLKIFRTLKPSADEKVMVLMFWIPFFGVWSASQHVPMYLDRYIIFASIGFYFAIMFIISRLKYSKVWITALILGFVFTFDPAAGHNSRIKDLVNHLKEHRSDDQIILIAPEWGGLEFAYHLDRELFSDHPNLEARMADLGIHLFHDGNRMVEAISDFPSEAIYIDGDNTGTEMSRSMVRELDKRYEEHHQDRQFKRYIVHRFSGRK